MKVAGRHEGVTWLRKDGTHPRLSRDHILESVYGSLERMDTDYIDMLYLGDWPDRCAYFRWSVGRLLCLSVGWLIGPLEVVARLIGCLRDWFDWLVCFVGLFAFLFVCCVKRFSIFFFVCFLQACLLACLFPCVSCFVSPVFLLPFFLVSSFERGKVLQRWS